MSDWSRTTIGELAEVFDGPHATPKKTDAGPWFLSISSLRNGRLRLEESAHLSDDEFDRWTRRVVPQENDVLFSYETRLGEAALTPAGLHACLGRRMGLLRPRPNKIDPRFLLYAYIGPEFQGTIRQRAVHGATVDRIPLSELPSWPLSIPALPEQQAIASVLGALDDKIEVNEKMAASSRALAQALFRRATNENDAQCEISSLADAITRGVAPRYTTDDSQLPVLNQKCIRDGCLNIKEARFTLREKVPSSKLLKSGDVLINSTGVGTLGRVARWTKDEVCTVDSHVSIVRFDQTKVDPLLGGLAMLAAQPEIESLGEGSTGQTELSRGKLGAVRITLPSSKEAAVLRPKLDVLEKRDNSALDEASILAQLRDVLLPKLMSREIRVRDAEKVVEERT